jgi:hypothetical protein
MRVFQLGGFKYPEAGLMQKLTLTETVKHGVTTVVEDRNLLALICCWLTPRSFGRSKPRREERRNDWISVFGVVISGAQYGTG